jgi:hypothetical protein
MAVGVHPGGVNPVGDHKGDIDAPSTSRHLTASASIHNRDTGRRAVARAWSAATSPCRVLAISETCDFDSKAMPWSGPRAPSIGELGRLVT